MQPIILREKNTEFAKIKKNTTEKYEIQQKSMLRAR